MSDALKKLGIGVFMSKAEYAAWKADWAADALALANEPTDADLKVLAHMVARWQQLKHVVEHAPRGDRWLKLRKRELAEAEFSLVSFCNSGFRNWGNIVRLQDGRTLMLSHAYGKITPIIKDL